MLNKIQKQIGTGITDGEQLSNIAKRFFGKKFIGIYPIRSIRSVEGTSMEQGTSKEQAANDVPPLKEGQVAILNRELHWFGAYRKNGKLYESDSYNIDELGRKYKDKDVGKGFIQPPSTADCGSRLLVNLYFALKG